MVIGDVTGSGLQAAVIMGRMRSALRAYAVIDQGLDQIRICSAGHLPPVVASPERPAYLADVITRPTEIDATNSPSTRPSKRRWPGSSG